MSVECYKNIINGGLVLSLDAYNTKSYVDGDTTAYDLTSNGNDGTLTNGVGFSDRMWTFDGVDDHIETPLSAEGISVMSIDCWLMLNSLPTGGVNQFHIAGQWNSTNPQRALTARIFNSTTIRLITCDGSSTLLSDISIGTLSINTWYHMVWVFNSGNGEFYLNGKKQGDFSGLHTTTNSSTPLSTFDIAQDSEPWGESNVNISTVNVYNIALTSSQVKENYNTIKWRFN